MLVAPLMSAGAYGMSFALDKSRQRANTDILQGGPLSGGGDFYLLPK
jgi:hypothetical protein